MSKFEKGHIVPKEWRKKISDTRKRLFREGKLKVWMEGKTHSEKARQKIRGKRKLQIITHSEKTRKKQSISKLGDKNPAKRFEVKEKIRKTMERISRMPNNKKEFSEFQKKLWQNKEYKEKMKVKLSIALKKKWQDKNFRERIIKATLKSLMKRPTSFEQKIIYLTNKYNLPFKYVGNGQILIGYKNPDFIETNGKKLLIEVHNKFHHQNNYEETRSKRFAKYGYKTLFINEDEVLSKNWENICLNKINSFLQLSLK